MIAAVVLGLLVEEDRPWAMEELVREIGDRPTTLDAIAELDRAGLAHRINKRFVWVSRAALQANRIERGGA
jgi:hypothetical protein